MIEATWRGGPWDGQSIHVIAGEQYFPLYTTSQHGLPLADRLPHTAPPRGSGPSLFCPIVTDPGGQLVIDWDHRLTPEAKRRDTGQPG